MNQKDRDQRLYVAQQGEKLRKGAISRREFMKRVGLAGFGLGAFGGIRPFSAIPHLTDERYEQLKGMSSTAWQNTDMAKWLKDVGGKFKGQTVRIASESTAPSQITSDLAAKEFVTATGIDIKWEQSPLDQVLSKITQDTATQSPSNDIYYLDQSWVGRFVEDTVDPQSYFDKKGSELNYPGYDFADFVPELVPALAAYGGRLVGVPFDIPIFIYAYRKDVFDKLKLKPATTMAEYLSNAKAINDAKLTNADGSQIYGVVGEWKSGHYALQCDWTAWLWSHGGSHFGKDEKVTINDDAALAGANYMLQLAEYMPPGATSWDWSGAGDAMTAGLGAQTILWGEFFPGWDGKDSKVSGMIETADLPKEDALRKKSETSYDEIPGIGHQGGSCLALSKYSKVQDAAWVFLQWATSKETIIAAAATSNTPVRTSAFNDKSVLDKAKVVAGTTRHFPAVLKAIKERMGTEPHFPGWATVSSTGGPIPTELGKMTTKSQDAKTTLNNIAKAIEAGLKE